MEMKDKLYQVIEKRMENKAVKSLFFKNNYSFNGLLKTVKRKRNTRAFRGNRIDKNSEECNRNME